MRHIVTDHGAIGISHAHVREGDDIIFLDNLEDLIVLWQAEGEGRWKVVGGLFCL